MQILRFYLVGQICSDAHQNDYDEKSNENHLRLFFFFLPEIVMFKMVVSEVL